ncbi:Down syndrome cell adhesion molecule-like protein Dscam2 [Amphibalanus amphitrite]|uniref:Down syndrome cell adhesion molecule-like protein Dscam2 n=1 Tax=Amphibalanus amphitrite TaxID=1232801 RepID=A0A6A4W0V8_AMPAM|nr:Down syndrome cell adhesion molecule-like protein Dscam2 [Amphibalanus amphitrite]
MENLIGGTENLIAVTENLIAGTENLIAVTENLIAVTENLIGGTENRTHTARGGFSVAAADTGLQGPVFVLEPPNTIDFSNSTGTVVECAARGSPPPRVTWVRGDGQPVDDVTGLRQVFSNGTLRFLAFRAEDYRQEIHAQVYRCLANNSEGSVVSRDVHVRAAVSQEYASGVIDQYVIVGNAAVLQCQIPSFVGDFVTVQSWEDSAGGTYFPSSGYVVSLDYRAETENEFVIRGNAAALRCKLPTFVAELVQVASWQDSAGGSYFPSQSYVVSQAYQVEIDNEFVVLGNAAVVQCKLPSYVADFVQVASWEDSDGGSYSILVAQQYSASVNPVYVVAGNAAVLRCELPSHVTDLVTVTSWVDGDGAVFFRSAGGGVSGDAVAQPYEASVEREYAIRGNAATMRCQIPSFVADFVTVQSWPFETDSDKEYVIVGNSGVLRCEVPSFVADFVSVQSWVDSDGATYFPSEDYAVSQPFETDSNKAYVIVGNSGVLRCEVPSFVADFVSVQSWVDSDGATYFPSEDYVVSQQYQTEVNNAHVIVGNAAVLACVVPSFVADFVQVASWEEAAGGSYFPSSRYAVSQQFNTEADNEYVIVGNSGVMRCEVPSFVADFVSVQSWVDSDGATYFPSEDYVVSQPYQTDVNTAHVIAGNSGVLSCVIPSFVADFVSVQAWTEAGGATHFASERSAVQQSYETRITDEFVIRGNAASLKCVLPSHVSDLVSVQSWEASDGSYGKYLVLPSGELHIRDVTPEDGLKSFRCRTVHRLTGETRLSATEGRLVVSEPVSAAPPQVTVSAQLNKALGRRGRPATLLCPGQGRPVPAFRLVEGRRSAPVTLLCPGQAAPPPQFRRPRFRRSEPVAATAPSAMSLPNAHQRTAAQAAALLCPSQAHPLPRFRLLGPAGRALTGAPFAEPVAAGRPQVQELSQLGQMTRRAAGALSLPCPGQAFPVPTFSPIAGLAEPVAATAPQGNSRVETSRTAAAARSSVALPCAEPVSAAAPGDASERDLKRQLHRAGRAVSLGCPAQGVPPPTFSELARTVTLQRRRGAALSLACPGQAFPVPTVRYGQLHRAAAVSSCSS